MDKKTMAMTLVTVICIILLVCIPVLLMNVKPARNTGSVREEPSTETVQEEDDKAFLKDPVFLDAYQPNVKEEDWEIAFDKNLFLSAASVERDLRVTVLDSLGRVVTGEHFYVQIKGVGEYKDLDADGVIYIDGLRPGNYGVSLQEKDDYIVPPEIKVSVKEKIEYARIEDISYLIKTEDEINAAEEDTKKANVEADETEFKEAWKNAEEGILGIDVSKWNREIDWNAVKGDGIEYVIIRCGYRGSKTGALVEDPYFRRNIEGATDAGLKVGIYFFTQALNEMEAVEEASMALSLVEGYDLDLPIFIDTESSGGRADSLDMATRTTVCKAFCDTIEASGEKAGIYASRNWYQTRISDDRFDDYVKWLAEYRKEPLYEGEYDLWQYTSSGSVSGIEGRVDMNLSYIAW